MIAIYERPTLAERGAFADRTRQFKRRYGWDQWRRRRRRGCGDDWDWND